MPKRTFSYSYPFKKKPRGLEKLAVEFKVFIPSTKGVSKIAANELKKRETEVKRFFAKITTGLTEGSERGIFGKVKEKIIILTLYLPRSVYLRNEVKIKEFLTKMKSEWQQEKLAFEFEGDLYFI